MEHKTEASQAVDELLADLKKAAKLSEAVGRSRGDNRYAQDSKSVTELVNLEMSIEERIRALARAALKAQPAPTEAWTKQAPTVQADYWHWNGDEDAAPSIVSVLYSGSARKCFVTMNCTYSGQAEMCDKYGGWWMRIEQPGLPGNEAQPSGNTGELAQGEDSARLEFMMQQEAWIAWSNDGESCRLFHRSEDGEPMPMLGWGARHWSHDPREAIDRARASAETGGVKP